MLGLLFSEEQINCASSQRVPHTHAATPAACLPLAWPRRPKHQGRCLETPQHKAQGLSLATSSCLQTRPNHKGPHTAIHIFISLFTGSGLSLLDLGSGNHSLRGSEFKGLAPQLPPHWARPRSARGRAPLLTPFLLALFLLRTPRQRPAPAGKKSPPPPLTNAPLIGGLRPASAQSPASAVAMATVDAARPGPPWPPTAPGCWWATGTRRRSWRR